MTVSPLGDTAVVLTLGEPVAAESTAQHVRAIAEEIGRQPPVGVVDVVPAFGSVAVFFDPTRAAPFASFCHELEVLVARANASATSHAGRTVEIPVCYDARFGPDLELIATTAKKSPAEVVALHAGADYLVQAIGFAPGFPYLGGLPPELAAPRRNTPRPRVAAGSVGIGGVLTGIYPLETPGGWMLIGRTPLAMFDATRPEPSLLQAGDRVRFRAITVEEFGAIAAGEGEDSRRETNTRNAANGQPSEVRQVQPGIEVVRAGMFTTVQDLGRRGHRARGVPLSGAADTFALRVANLLVGNPEDAAGLEFTLVGPTLKFLHDTLIAIGGAEFSKLPRWRPMAIRGGTTLEIGPALSGCRGYLAVAGGIEVQPVLGSRSTYVRGRLGGQEGRRLGDGDRLPVPDVRRTFRNHWYIDERIVPRYASSAMIRVLAGEHAGQFDADWTTRVFKVSTQSDRMGVRMTGAPLQREGEGDLISSPVAPGTVQVPPDGDPIVLLADAQTIGGYPQLAHVIAVDLPVVAQLRPGDEARFVLVTLDDARELIAAQERALGLLREGLAQKLA